MASYREKNGTWYFRISVPDKYGNVRQIERKGGKTREEAEVACNKLLAVVEYNRGLYLPENITVKTMLEQWLEEHVEPHLKSNTLITYTMAVNQIIVPYIGNNKLAKLTPMMAQRFINEITPNYSKSTAKTTLGVLRSAFRKAVVFYGYVDTNPFAEVKVPRTYKKKRQTHPFTPGQIEDALTHFNSKHTELHLAILIAYHTGLRLGEVLGLAWEHIDLNADMLTVQQIMLGDGTLQETPKTHASHRTIPFDDVLHDILLKEYQRQEKQRYHVYYNYNPLGLVCVGDHGEPASYYKCSHNFRNYVFGLYGEGYHFHSIRHTHATILLENGEELEAVSKRLGHTNISITAATYSHVLDKRNEKMRGSLNRIFAKH